MSQEVDAFSEREEIEMLLPWYVTGRLGRSDRDRVAAYLSAHPDVRRQLALIGEERHESVRQNEAIAGPGSAWQARIMAKARAGGGFGSGVRALWTRVEEFLTQPSAGAVQWAVALASVLIMAEAALIGALLMSTREGAFETAGRPSASAPESGAFALVRFTETAQAQAIFDVFTELGVTIIEGPKPGRLFKVRLGPADMTAAAREKRITALRQREDVVKLVLPGS